MHSVYPKTLPERIICLSYVCVLKNYLISREFVQHFDQFQTKKYAIQPIDQS